MGTGYNASVRDLVFVLLAVGFFALVVLFVRACELVVDARPPVEERANP